MFGNKQNRTLGRAHLAVASRGGFPAKAMMHKPKPLYSSTPSFAFIIWFLFLKEESKLFKLKESKLFKVPWHLGTHAAGKLLHLGSSLGQVKWGRLRGRLTPTRSHSFWMNTNKPRAAGRCELCSGTVVQLQLWQESSWSQLHLQSRHLNVWDCRHKLLPTFYRAGCATTKQTLFRARALFDFQVRASSSPWPSPPLTHAASLYRLRTALYYRRARCLQSRTFCESFDPAIPCGGIYSEEIILLFIMKSV